MKDNAEQNQDGGFENKAGTEIIKKLEQDSESKIENKLSKYDYSKPDISKKLSIIREDEKESFTDPRSKDQGAEIILSTEEKKKLEGVQEKDEISKHEDGSPNKDKIKEEVKAPSSPSEHLGTEIKNSIANIELTNGIFNSIMFKSVINHLIGLVNKHYYKDKETEADPEIDPQILYNFLNLNPITLRDKLLGESLKSCINAQAILNSKKNEQPASQLSNSMQKPKEDNSKDYRNLIWRLIELMGKIATKSENHLRLLAESRPEKPKPNNNVLEIIITEAQKLLADSQVYVLPLHVYIQHQMKKPKSHQMLDIIRYLSFAYSRKDMADIFLKTFYNQFDDKYTYIMNMTDFMTNINFIADKLHDREFMEEIFKLMGVPAESKALKIMGTSSVSGTIFDVSVYRKAFLQIREFETKEETKDVVLFRRLFPYLYCFYTIFEIDSLKRRRKLYKNFRTWIVEAFREARSLKTPGSGVKEGSNISLADMYTYDEIVKALSILQAKHFENFGNAEFRIITEHMQELLDVDPVTFKSIKTAPLSCKSVVAMPIGLWEKDITHRGFSLEQYLSLKCSELSMFQALNLKQKQDDSEYLREERLLLYNEAELVGSKTKLGKYFERLYAVETEHSIDKEENSSENSMAQKDDSDSTDKLIERIVKDVSSIYPGFDKIDATLVVLHYLRANMPGEGKINLPNKIAKEDQEKLYKNMVPLLNQALYERFYGLYLQIFGKINLQTVSDIINYEPSKKEAKLLDKENNVDTSSIPEEKEQLENMLNDASNLNKTLKKEDKKVGEDILKNQDLLILEEEVVKPKREIQFEKEATVFEGVELRSKKRKQVSKKYVDMTGIKFSISKEREIARQEQEKKNENCIIL